MNQYTDEDKLAPVSIKFPKFCIWFSLSLVANEMKQTRQEKKKVKSSNRLASFKQSKNDTTDMMTTAAVAASEST